MQVFDNINKTVKDDLTVTIEKGCKLSIAAACFSIYAYQALKKQLDGIDDLRFIRRSLYGLIPRGLPRLKVRI